MYKKGGGWTKGFDYWLELAWSTSSYLIVFSRETIECSTTCWYFFMKLSMKIATETHSGTYPPSNPARDSRKRFHLLREKNNNGNIFGSFLWCTAVRVCCSTGACTFLRAEPPAHFHEPRGYQMLFDMSRSDHILFSWPLTLLMLVYRHGQHVRIFPFRMLSQKARGEIGHTHLSSDVRLLFMSASLSALAFSSACSSLSWERCRFTSTDRSSRSRVCNHRRHDTKKKKKKRKATRQIGRTVHASDRPRSRSPTDIHPKVPLWDVVQTLYSADPTQETCPTVRRACR